MPQSFLPVSKLTQEPYSLVLGFPKATKRQLESRLAELKKLGISQVSFQGPTRIKTLDILGKGYVGIVVLAKKRGKIVALKIRRTDSQRKEMMREAQLLKLANKAGVGPKLIESSKNFVVMEYLAGEKIGNWVTSLKGKGIVKKLKTTARRVLEDCYSLDKAGFDHGELSSITKHIIVSDSKATMIDFESSSTERRVSNVTSATQAIFIGSGISKHVQKIYKIPTKRKMISALRKYKQSPSRKSFDSVLKTLKL